MKQLVAGATVWPNFKRPSAGRNCPKRIQPGLGRPGHKKKVYKIEEGKKVAAKFIPSTVF